MAKKLIAPKAAIKNKEITIHNHTRVDPYYWLNEKDNPAVIKYLNEENEYLDAVMEDTKTFQAKLFDEIVGRIKKDDEGVPYLNNGYYYYHRFENEKEYPIYCRKKNANAAKEQVILDVNDLAEGHDYYHAKGLKPSPDTKILAFGEDTVSRRIYTIRFKNLDTGAFLNDQIDNTEGYVVWSADGQYVFYTRKDETLRPHKVLRHKIGTPVEEDVEIWHEEDPTFYTSIYKSASQQYIIISSSSTVTNSFQFLRADHPTGDFQQFNPRQRGLEYMINHGEKGFYVLTNWNAENFRLMVCPSDRTTQEHWQEVIPHRTDVFLEDMDVFKDFIVLHERINGITQLRIITHVGEDYHVPFEDDSFTAFTFNNKDYNTTALRIGYTSLRKPFTVYDFDLSDKSLLQRKEQEVVGGYESSQYVSERVYATARDGAQIPISIVYKRGYKNGTKKPLLLYAYGSYGHSIDPTFSTSRLSLLDRGFAFAIAHIRGGQELGRRWYEHGKLLKKKNTFTDYIDCAEFLLKNDYLDNGHLYAMGGSAGGLLMGAVINEAPHLFNGVIAAVPFVDVVTTMLDESIPLTTGEFDEWGNPKDETYYHYILSYSPYDQVKAQAYPNLLVTTGLHDSQVQYWEPAKWVAKLRKYKTDSNLLLLYTNMSTGHGGASGRFNKHKETALEYAFLLSLEGIFE